MKGALKNITILQLESLYNLIEEGSFSRAAKKMRLTQPSLSKHIQNLEDIIESKVVDRKNTGIEVTPEGNVLLECSKRVFRQIKEAEQRLALFKNSEKGSISIAASTIPATYLLPPVLSTFRHKYPEIHCFIKMNDSGMVINQILDGEAELGFVGRSVANRTLNSVRLWKDELVLAAYPGHPFCSRKTVSWDDVMEEPFVVREHGSATRASLETYVEENLNRKFSSFNVVCEMGSSEAVKEAIIAGLGISILSAHAVRREFKTGVLFSVALPAPPIERYCYLIYKKQFSAKKHHHLFLDFLKTGCLKEQTRNDFVSEHK
ncbi:MAG: selenium metabolism-associated LysR family transcriptional regulator [Syntrophales bacterium]|jgi:DNA-binding transcriptional LysR family regulator|nr:selenium metabolism-associated LysR family transcriptional regulator [Syntrophales bacterium]MDY0044074.1 selenium metabolism-associated LysR family transcriptional regulator [Syntrophales bacterium]